LNAGVSLYARLPGCLRSGNAAGSYGAPATGPIVSGYHNTKCVDDLGDSATNDTPVVIFDCNGSPEQDWTVPGDGTLRVNGKCVDIYRQQKVNKAKVELWTCTGRANQQWAAAPCAVGIRREWCM